MMIKFKLQPFQKTITVITCLLLLVTVLFAAVATALPVSAQAGGPPGGGGGRPATNTPAPTATPTATPSGSDPTPTATPSGSDPTPTPAPTATPTSSGSWGTAVGLGSYTTTLPSGAVGVCEAYDPKQCKPASPLITSTFNKPIQTSDWWTSMIWKRGTVVYSNNMFPHPLSMKAYNNGLGVGYPNAYTIPRQQLGRDFFYNYTEDLVVGVAGLNAPDTRVEDYGDWSVTGSWSDGTRSLKATFGRGIPFVYFIKSGGDASITFKSTPNIWYNSNGVIGATVNGRHYGIFAPHGSSWSGTTTRTSTLSGKDYFSVAVLPDNTTATLEFYRKHAYAFVTDTRVSWSYNQSSAVVTSTYTVTTTLKENINNNVNATIQALYPHQWKNSSNALTSYTYVSARGTMKVLAGNTFSTQMTFNGVLPSMPNAGAYDLNQLTTYINQVVNEGDHWGDCPEQPCTDTYWQGKELGRMANLVWISDQIGHTSARDYFLNQIKSRMQDWLTASSSTDGSQFYYSSEWNTLIGYPEGYGSGTSINDHHFHYGYFVFAAATIAHFEPSWANQSNWGGMIELLIKDPANWDRSDTRFPFLRTYDPYAGHSWASGPAEFAEGNNQESSSEAQLMATGMILWGAVTNNTTIRDLGVFLHTNETRAVEQYWFDVDGDNFPSDYKHKTLGMVWDSGGKYNTWWTTNPEEVHGINMLPINGGSTFLGRYPNYVKANWDHMVSENKGEPTVWQDILWSFYAFYDANDAVNKFHANQNYAPEAGDSKARTFHWLYNLKEMGRLDTTVTANIPTYAVFINGSTRTYVAYNPGSTSITVNFSNGKSLTVPARSLVHSK
jgi:endoglucanase Acf2